MPEEAYPFPKLAPCSAPMCLSSGKANRRPDSDRHEQDRKNESSRGIEHVNDSGAAQNGDDQPGEGRANHRGQLPGTAAPRRGILEGLVRYNARGERRGGGSVESHGDAHEQYTAIDQGERPMPV